MRDIEDLQQKIISLCKRRGFVYPGSEIYGGLANTYDYGPLGSLMMRNIQNLWWENFITKRSDIWFRHCDSYGSGGLDCFRAYSEFQ